MSNIDCKLPYCVFLRDKFDLNYFIIIITVIIFVIMIIIFFIDIIL